MKKLPENYVVICNNKTESDVAINYVNKSDDSWFSWNYIVVAGNMNDRFDKIEYVEEWFLAKSLSYITLTFKEFNDIINKTNQEMENKLPKIWHLKITSDNKKIINDVKIKQHEMYENLFKFDYVYVQSLGVYDGEFGGVNNYYENSVEITTEQFKSYYLKENKTEMKKQTLTRNQLIKLRTQSDCSTWKSEIDSILTANILTKGMLYDVPESSIKLLIKDGTDKQKKLVSKLGIVLSKSEEEQYLENQANCGLSVGDTVKITRTVKSFENGWVCFWNDNMNSCINKVGKVTKITNEGFEIDFCSNFWFPYFVLEKVVEEWIPFDFNDDLVGKVLKTKAGTAKYLITLQDELSVKLPHAAITYIDLLKKCTFLDGTPCGKLKQ